MADNPVRWFEIYVQDMKRARKFYEAVFKVRIEKLDTPAFDMWSFPWRMGQPGTSGALVKMEGVPSGGNSVIVYFGCDDCAVEEELAAKSGGGIEKSKTSIGQYGYISLIHDTEGNLIGLHSLK